MFADAENELIKTHHEGCAPFLIMNEGAGTFTASSFTVTAANDTKRPSRVDAKASAVRCRSQGGKEEKTSVMREKVLKRTAILTGAPQRRRACGLLLE